MVTPQEKAQCVFWFIKTKSDVQTQRRYRTRYGKNPPSRSSIRRWHKKFMETGSVLDAMRTGRPRISEENIESVRQAFSRSPMMSIRSTFRQLELPPTKVLKVLHKRLRLHAYKVQMFRDFNQMTSRNKKSLQITCCTEFLRMKNFLSKFVLVTRQRFMFLVN